MTTFDEYFRVIGTFQGLLLFSLLICDRRLSPASKHLAMLCLIIAIECLLPFFFLSSAVYAPYVVSLLMFFPASGGAFAYLYCRTALLETPFKKGDILFFVPFVMCYLLSIKIIVFHPAEAREWVIGEPSKSWHLQASEYLLFLQAFGFAILTSRMIWHYRVKAADSLSNYNPLVFNWMLALQIFTILIWTLNAFPAFSSAPYIMAQLADVVMVGLVYVIGIAQWRAPHLFSVPRLAEQDKANADAPFNDGDRGELDPETRENMFKALESIMQEKKLYLDNDLTLSGLAQSTGMTRHHLSEVLNRHVGKNFYEFINEYRVHEVCKLLRTNTNANILSVAFDAGFSSKSAFNVIFKHFTGQTPSQYKKTYQSHKTLDKA